VVSPYVYILCFDKLTPSITLSYPPPPPFFFLVGLNSEFEFRALYLQSEKKKARITDVNHWYPVFFFFFLCFALSFLPSVSFIMLFNRKIF
jgi:hypothetical protein